jgi:hypothetical protein
MCLTEKRWKAGYPSTTGWSVKKQEMRMNTTNAIRLVSDDELETVAGGRDCQADLLMSILHKAASAILAAFGNYDAAVKYAMIGSNEARGCLPPQGK